MRISKEVHVNSDLSDLFSEKILVIQINNVVYSEPYWSMEKDRQEADLNIYEDLVYIKMDFPINGEKRELVESGGFFLDNWRATWNWFRLKLLIPMKHLAQCWHTVSEWSINNIVIFRKTNKATFPPHFLHSNRF